MSFPRAGRICAAQILAELGSVRERFDSDEHLAAEAGVAPVTYASGKTKAVTFRWACNHRLRAALTCLADNSRHASAWAAHVYAKAEPAAAIIRTPSASSPAPGCASSGAPGTIANPTTPPTIGAAQLAAQNSRGLTQGVSWTTLRAARCGTSARERPGALMPASPARPRPRRSAPADPAPSPGPCRRPSSAHPAWSPRRSARARWPARRGSPLPAGPGR